MSSTARAGGTASTTWLAETAPPAPWTRTRSSRTCAAVTGSAWCSVPAGSCSAARWHSACAPWVNQPERTSSGLPLMRCGPRPSASDIASPASDCSNVPTPSCSASAWTCGSFGQNPRRAEVDDTGVAADAQEPTADAVPSLVHDDGAARRQESASSAEAGDARAHDDHIDVSRVGHVSLLGRGPCGNRAAPAGTRDTGEGRGLFSVVCLRPHVPKGQHRQGRPHLPRVAVVSGSGAATVA